jgi:hypothetical protein
MRTGRAISPPRDAAENFVDPRRGLEEQAVMADESARLRTAFARLTIDP